MVKQKEFTTQANVNTLTDMKDRVSIVKNYGKTKSMN